MLTDTNWLLTALQAEIKQTGAADEVVVWNSTDVSAALDALRNYKKKVVFVVPGEIEYDHRFQASLPIVAYIGRCATILCCAGEPGKTGGDLAEATAIFDKVESKLMWNSLGTNSTAQVISLPLSASPVDVSGDGTACRAVWRLDVKVQCREKTI